MKIKIEYEIDLCDDELRAIAEFYGEDGLASEDDVKEFFYQGPILYLKDLVMELEDEDLDN